MFNIDLAFAQWRLKFVSADLATERKWSTTRRANTNTDAKIRHSTLTNINQAQRNHCRITKKRINKRGKTAEKKSVNTFNINIASTLSRSILSAEVAPTHRALSLAFAVCVCK